LLIVLALKLVGGSKNNKNFNCDKIRNAVKKVLSLSMNPDFVTITIFKCNIAPVFLGKI
jgi:hypothetical protein